MSKTDWGHVFTYFHLIGFALILTLPISAIMLQTEMGKRDFGVVSRLGVFLGRMDRVAQVGALILLLSGTGQMWAKNITFSSLGGADRWLGVKLVLFAILVVNGIFTAGPGIRRRVQLLVAIAGGGGTPTEEQEGELVKTANYMRITGIPQIVLLVLIIILAAFGYLPGR